MKRVMASCFAVALVIAGWAAYQGVTQASRSSFARLMPPDAVLFLESPDFGAILREWNASPEKKAWLATDNYEVFSRSRLFLRLKRAQDEFAVAAGVPPDMAFLNDVAGEQSALGIYDIGNLELLYITRLPSARAMKSGIWQQRAKFETRQVAGKTFYVRTDPESERVTAFAFADDYLILGTREDLVAGALSLVAKQKAATLAEQGWFVDALKAAKDPGELRMVINLAEVTQTPQFRTYWAPQNITEMREYQSSVTDLVRSSDTYREERVLLLNDKPESSDSEQSRQIAELMRLVPPGVGFYRASLAASSDDALSELEQKILTPRLGPAPVSKLAPGVQTGAQTVGSASNLETRIDVAPSKGTVQKSGDEELKELFNKAGVRPMLQLHRSEAAADGVFVRLRSTMVLRGTADWDEAAVQAAVQRVITPGLTTATIGAAWKKTGAGAQMYSELDGLARIAIAVRGKYLFASDDPETLAVALARINAPVSSEPAIYYAGFDHARERQNFYQLTTLVDRPGRSSFSGSERQPEFFSENVASLSKVFAGVTKQSIVAKRDQGVETQTVLYEWEK